MTIDLWMLLASTLLNFVLVAAAAVPSILGDLNWAAGNRETQPDMPPWQGRIHRAAQNMKENLPLFIAVVLVVHVSGNNDATSALGAEIFFGARVLHAIVYSVGIPWVRTLLWVTSLVGMGLMISTVF